MTDNAHLIGALESPDEAIRVAALLALSELPAERFDWSLVMSLGGCLEGTAAVAAKAGEVITRLGERRVDLRAVLQRSPSLLRYGPDAHRQRAAAVLEQAVVALNPQARAWAPIALDPYTSDLVELLKLDDRAAQLGIELLDQAAATNPDGVAISLYIRWTEIPAAVLARLRPRLDARDPAIMKRAVREQPEKSPLAVETFLGAVGHRGGPFLVAEGQYAPDPAKSVRITIVCAGRSIADGWLATGDLSALRRALAALGPVRVAECDTMYATGMARAWTTDGPPFELWDEGERRLWQEGDALHERGGRALPAAEIVNVEVYLEEGWVVRGVRCNLKDGGKVQVAEERDAISLIDPTYDGINLMCETSWAVSLGSAIGEALGVTVVFDEAL